MPGRACALRGALRLGSVHAASHGLFNTPAERGQASLGAGIPSSECGRRPAAFRGAAGRARGPRPPAPYPLPSNPARRDAFRCDECDRPPRAAPRLLARPARAACRAEQRRWADGGAVVTWWLLVRRGDLSRGAGQEPGLWGRGSRFLVQTSIGAGTDQHRRSSAMVSAKHQNPEICAIARASKPGCASRTARQPFSRGARRAARSA